LITLTSESVSGNEYLLYDFSFSFKENGQKGVRDFSQRLIITNKD
jgi:hypothetical protein